jgi:hypothetical protein
MKIYAPVKDFNGLRNSVRFVNGVGETNEPKVAEWFKAHGYSVEDNHTVETKTEQVEVVETVEEIEPVEIPDNLDDMSPFALRQWALDNGFGGVIRNTRSKDKLLEIIKNHRG